MIDAAFCAAEEGVLTRAKLEHRCGCGEYQYEHSLLVRLIHP